MTAVSRGRTITFLLRAGLLTAALAIIAGIFGMHMMTGAHNMVPVHKMPASGAGHAEAQTHTVPAGHSSHRTEPSLPGTSIAGAVKGSSSSNSLAGSCPEMSAAGAGCVLSPGNTSFSAPLPGTATYALPDFDGAAAAGTNYSYSPDSPSPGDLCISRT